MLYIFRFGLSNRFDAEFPSSLAGKVCDDNNRYHNNLICCRVFLYAVNLSGGFGGVSPWWVVSRTSTGVQIISFSCGILRKCW